MDPELAWALSSSAVIRWARSPGAHSEALFASASGEALLGSGLIPAIWGARSSITSSTHSTRTAPSLNSWLLPRVLPVRGLPGTAKTWRSCSSACRAVIKEPLFSAASTTTTPSEARQDSVAARKILRQRWGAEREFAKNRPALLDDFVGKFAMLGRVGDIDAAAEHHNCTAAGLERPAMGCGVDSSRQAAYYDEATAASSSPSRCAILSPASLAARAPTTAMQAVSVAVNVPPTVR